jgi:protein-S-isoprenylcysteine O-methyltransferase Ste14
MNKLNFYGIGPKIGRIALPWFAVTIAVSLLYKPFFSIYRGESELLFYTGLAMLASGFILYFSTLPLLLKGIRETKLVTGGAYYLCRNPLYAAFLLLLLPGTAFMLNSWLILTAPVTGYILFKKNIKNECKEMEEFFGNDYKKYASETPELFPLPLKKWFSH